MSSILILGYTGLVLAVCIRAGLAMEASTGHHAPWNLDSTPVLSSMLGIFGALGAFLKPYGGHGIAIDLQVPPAFPNQAVSAEVGKKG